MVSRVYDSDFVLRTTPKKQKPDKISYLVFLRTGRDSNPSRLSRDRDRAAY
jgi:hypothetical protein